MTPLPSQRTRQRRLRRPSKVTPARWAAWLTLRRTFDEDAWTDRAFAAVAQQLDLDQDPRERAFAQRLAYGTVQQAKQLDHVIGVLGRRPLHRLDAPVLHALRLGTYELLHLQQRIGQDGERLGSSSAHAAVDQAVELVRGVVGERAVAFTNAILRRAQVDGAAILERLDQADDADLAVLLSMPHWLVSRARQGHGERGMDALRAQNEPHPGTAFRVNTAHPHASGVLDRLAAAGVEAVPLELAGVPLPGAITVSGATGALEAFIAEGAILPQSLASQLVTHALHPRPGERVLDMCAAPGGKTTHLAAFMGCEGEVVAVELHEHRAESIRQLARRTRTDDVVDVLVADATTLEPTDLGTFDRVLLDAPCTGTGVLAARPDARWKRSEESLMELMQLQARLLATAARMVRPGGTVVYSTCSILREEDEDVVADAPAQLHATPLEHVPPGLHARDADHVARTWPQEHGTDGFFLAAFTRVGGEV